MTRYEAIKIPASDDSDISPHKPVQSEEKTQWELYSLFVAGECQNVQRANDPPGCTSSEKNLMPRPEVGSIPLFLYCSLAGRLNIFHQSVQVTVHQIGFNESLCRLVQKGNLFVLMSREVPGFDLFHVSELRHGETYLSLWAERPVIIFLVKDKVECEPLLLLLLGQSFDANQLGIRKHLLVRLQEEMMLPSQSRTCGSTS